jgi:hypothetical protein
MRNFNILAAAGAAVLLGGTALAGSKAENPDKVICKYEGDSTSRISRTRVCRSRAEWAMEAEARRRDAEQGIENAARRTELQNTYRNNVSENSGSAPR